MSAPAGWQVVEGKLHRRFQFKDFVQAMKFVNAMADAAEAADHHPDFTVHYNVVDVSLWSHDKNSITERDHALARKIDTLV